MTHLVLIPSLERHEQCGTVMYFTAEQALVEALVEALVGGNQDKR